MKGQLKFHIRGEVKAFHSERVVYKEIAAAGKTTGLSTGHAVHIILAELQK